MQSVNRQLDQTPLREKINLLSERDYQELNSHVFPTIHSLKWFIRKNRDRLAVSGSILLISGRTFISPIVFGATTISIGLSKGSSCEGGRP